MRNNSQISEQKYIKTEMEGGFDIVSVCKDNYVIYTCGLDQIGN